LLKISSAFCVHNPPLALEPLEVFKTSCVNGSPKVPQLWIGYKSLP